jgi:hypothetical protein
VNGQGKVVQRTYSAVSFLAQVQKHDLEDVTEGIKVVDPGP